MNQINELLKNVRKADEDYQMIDENAKILVGLSGGKDSIVLLEILRRYQMFEHKHFQLMALHLNMGLENEDFTVVAKYCHHNQIPLIELSFPLYDILKHYEKHGKIDCARCSNLKRGIIVDCAIKNGCTHIAFGHHGDDAVETLVMNSIQGARLESFNPKIYYEDNNITFIRPLIYAEEKRIESVFKRLNLPMVSYHCPADGYTIRTKIKNMLKQLYEEYPQAHHNLIKCATQKKSD